MGKRSGGRRQRRNAKASGSGKPLKGAMATAFQKLGHANKITVGLGQNPESVIFTIEILHEPTEPTYTIEYFCTPDTAMALLQILEEIRKRENYQLPAIAIKPQSYQ